VQLTFSEFCAVMWRGSIALLAIVAVAVGAAVGALRLQHPVYQSTATLQVVGSDLSVLSHIDAITPVYAEAIQSAQTGRAAQDLVDGPLAQITARTFTGSPVVKVDAQSGSPQLAQQSAQAIVDVVNRQSDAGQYGFRSVRLTEIQPPQVPVDPISPRPALTLGVAVVAGLALGTIAALLQEAVRRRRHPRAQLAAAPRTASGSR